MLAEKPLRCATAVRYPNHMRNMLRVVCLLLVVVGLAMMFGTQPNDNVTQKYGVWLVLMFSTGLLALFVKKAI